ncbi:MAG: hypothetical protein LC101_06730 [Flavobacteriales bacterium]|nr:hypothetical protein [Flavobacteriales bacterium]
MSFKQSFILISAIAWLSSSCTPRLVNAWNIQLYETKVPGENASGHTNIGSIIFYKDGTGEKNASFSLFGKAKTDFNTFTWKRDGKYLLIDNQQTGSSKVWFLVKSNSNVLRWMTTNGSSEVQIIELQKISKK